MLEPAMTTPSMATMETDGIRILLVDDHTILREGLAAVLNAVEGFEVVGQTGDGHAALNAYKELSPDVAIVDLRMTPMDGVTLTQALRDVNPNARVNLLKDVDSGRLADTIRAVHAGRKEIPPEIAAKLADHVASETLTPRQEEVLRGVAEGKSNLEIAKALFVSEGTVKAHVKAILQKLGARDRTQAITIAIKRGLVRPL
jgi:two-component system NarL family response regulator